MPFVSTQDSPEFSLPGVVFHGLAAPSRGATENAVWRVRLDARTVGSIHQLTREETIVGTAGRATATLDGLHFDMVAGSAVIVPPDVDFALSNPYDEPFEAVAVIAIGGQARMPDGATFTPPWAE